MVWLRGADWVTFASVTPVQILNQTRFYLLVKFDHEDNAQTSRKTIGVPWYKVYPGIPGWLNK